MGSPLVLPSPMFGRGVGGEARSTPDRLALHVTNGDRPALAHLLTAGSHLPGPRANLALARRFAAEAAALPALNLIALIAPWLDLTLDEAPVDSPAEFLPAGAAIALGAALAGPDADVTTLELLLERAAHDPRWRTREGLVLGLQVAGERDGPRLLTLCDSWIASGDAYRMRAVVSTLAHTPILRHPGAAEIALRHGRAAIDWLQGQPAARRATEGSETLTRSLGFALSVYVAAAPGPGFDLLDALLAGGDRATRRIVNQTLGHAGLAKAQATQVTRLKGWIFEMDDWQRG